MDRWRVWWVGLRLAMLCVALAIGAAADAAATRPQRATGTLPSRPWPQSESDIAADPAVLFGTLANGLRYAILPNQLPSGQVAFRLRIDAGSADEADNEQGLAHFIEHMAYRGSTHVPDNEAFRILERFGAARGADSNAFTTQSETVFKIDLPKNTPDGIDTALMLLRETASEMQLRPEAVDQERPVVLSEERLRDSPVGRLNKEEMAFVFKDQPIGLRPPIGSVAVLKAAQAPDLRRFYQAFYHPERATLVVVGDIKPAALQALIKSRFGDWRGHGAAGAPPPLGPPLPRGAEVKVKVEPGVPSVATVEWTAPADPRPDTLARERDDALLMLGLMAFNQRLQDRAHGEAPPFLAAHALHSSLGGSGQLTALALGSTEQGWRQSLIAGISALNSALADGLRQDEIDRQRLAWRSALETNAAGAATRKSSALADELVHSVDSEDVFVAPAFDLALFDRIMADAPLEQVNAALRRAFAGNGPLTFVASPNPIEGVEAVLQEAARPAAAAAAAAAPSVWPYTDFGPAGTVVDRRQEQDLGLTLLRFANGVRLTVKPTQYRADQILLAVDVGHGRLDLPTDRSTLAWAADAGALIAGGLKALSVPDIDRLLAGKQAGVRFSVGDDAFIFSGGTRPQDFDIELQLLAAALTAPGWRAEGFESVRNRMITALPQWQASPLGVFQRQAGFLLHDGDPRWQTPDLAQLQAARLPDLQSLLDPLLAYAPIEITVVGDITVERAIAGVAATFGALPARATETPVPAAERAVHFPAPKSQPLLLLHQGRADQGLAVAVWPAMDSIADLQRPRTLRVMQLILQQRLIDEFRTRLGDSYSPASDIQTSVQFPGYGYLLALAETPPDKMDMFDQTLADIASDLAAREPSADEFERARRPRVEALKKAQQTNEWWLGLLQRAQTEDITLPLIRTVFSDLDSVTPAMVRQIAAETLQDDRLWRLRITPAAQSTETAR